MIKVLIVDDDFMVASTHRNYVERVPGFTVVGETYSGEQTLRACEQHRPDLMLLDIYLPDVHGLDVLGHLRTEGYPRVDVLAITAARDVDTVRAALQQGVVHYLIKPFRFAALRESLERYAQAHHELSKSGQLIQDDVDRMYETLRTKVSRPLPKGLSQTTCELVATTLRESTPAAEDLSAVEIAERTGLSRPSVRRYLEYLTSTGQARLRARYGSAGRPEHRYRWSQR